MCGIFFSIGFENLSPQVIDSVTHRGPDGRGWNEFKSPNGPVIMAHRRLSIIDLSEDGHQPMSSQDGRYWITYNGEIYNYLELRQELESLGYKFQTHTDTEVLLKSFIHWGPDCLNKFNGMFAFVIWDEKEKKAFVARDRFGIKPLYYYRQGNKIAFASEIKQFTYLPGFESKLNHKIAYHVFTSKLIHDGYETLFQGVYQLLGGEFLSLEKNNVRSFASQKWYDIAKVNVNKKTSEEASKSFKKLFFDSVNLRLRSDVSVGSCLSGGIDSSSIVSMLGELSDSKNGIKTFSACYKNDPLDESHYIDIVTKHTGIKNTKVYPDPKNFMNLWEKMVYHHDAPIGGATVFAQNQVFQCANQHKIKVMLDGQGADEVFAGYHSMFGAFHAELFNTLKFLKLISEIKSCKNLHGYNYKALLLRVLETFW